MLNVSAIKAKQPGGGGSPHSQRLLWGGLMSRRDSGDDGYFEARMQMPLTDPMVSFSSEWGSSAVRRGGARQARPALLGPLRRTDLSISATSRL